MSVPYLNKHVGGRYSMQVIDVTCLNEHVGGKNSMQGLKNTGQTVGCYTN